MRYFRCTNPDCRRKWHHISIAHIAATKMQVRTDLLDQPMTPEPGVWLCPACHADLKPERGTFDDLFPAIDRPATKMVHVRPEDRETALRLVRDEEERNRHAFSGITDLMLGSAP